MFNQALALCNSGDVRDVEYDDDTVTISGKIGRPDGWGMPVSLVLKEKGRIESHCPCYANTKLGQVCPHVVAIGIAQMVMEAEAEELEERETGRAPSDGPADGDAEGGADEAAEFNERPATPSSPGRARRSR